MSASHDHSVIVSSKSMRSTVLGLTVVVLQVWDRVVAGDGTVGSWSAKKRLNPSSGRLLCISCDDSCVAAGSVEGLVHVWALGVESC